MDTRDTTLKGEWLRRRGHISVDREDDIMHPEELYDIDILYWRTTSRVNTHGRKPELAHCTRHGKAITALRNNDAPPSLSQVKDYQTIRSLL